MVPHRWRAVRVEEGGGGVDLGEGTGGFPADLRALLVGGIHRAGHAGIDLHPGRPLGKCLQRLHELDERAGSFCEAPLEGFDGGQALQDALYFSIKGCDGWKHAFGVPGLFLFHFGAGQGGGHADSSLVSGWSLRARGNFRMSCRYTGHVGVFLFGVIEAEVFCGLATHQAEELSHGEQGFPDVFRVKIGIGAFQLFPELRGERALDVLARLAGAFWKFVCTPKYQLSIFISCSRTTQSRSMA